MADAAPQEDRIQSLANVLSLLAIISGMDKTAVQRVLITLGSNLIAVPGEQPISADLAGQLLAHIAREEGKSAALRVATDMDFVAKAWKPVLSEYDTSNPQRQMPYAEVLFALFNFSAYTLHQYGAFDRFGGPDVVLAMPQLTAALKTYHVPVPGLVWEIVGFDDPPDQALVASTAEDMFLFKAASSPVILRFSELARNEDNGPRQEHDVRVDAALFGAFVAGLMGDMLYWAARLRADAVSGRQTWRAIQALITPPSEWPPVRLEDTSPSATPDAPAPEESPTPRTEAPTPAESE
jgi:hypothetical protein